MVVAVANKEEPMIKGAQTKRVLEYLQSGKTLTSKQAFDKWGITRLSAIIFNLRKNGYDISMTTDNGFNRYGEAVHWGVYKLNTTDLLKMSER